MYNCCGDTMNKKKLCSLKKKLNKYQTKLDKLNEKTKKHFLIEYKINKLIKKIELLKDIINIHETENKEFVKEKVSLLKEEHKRHEILYGNIVSTILMVCMPIALYSFFNSFYELIDSVMCASIDPISVSNVAALSQVKNAIRAFGMGLGGGGGVLVARYYGANRMKDAKKSVGNLFFLTLAMSAFIILLMVPMSSIIVSLVCNGGPDVQLYFSLQTFELAIIAINTIWIAIEKVKGNSKRILSLNLIVLVIKLSLNAVFVYWIKVDSIVWIEVSSIIAQSFLCVIAIKTLFSSKNILRVETKYIKPESMYIIPILKLSIPVFLGKFVMNIGKLSVNILSDQFYGEVTGGLIVGALAVSNNLSGLITSPTNSFEEGESSIVSQNLGNKNADRTLKVFYKSAIIIMTISLIGYICVRFLFLDELVNLFKNTKDDLNAEESLKLVAYIKEIFVYDSLSIPTLGITACVLGLLYGYGKTFLSSILNFSRIGTRIITLLILYWVNGPDDYQSVGIAMGISNIVIMLLSIIFLLIFLSNFKEESQKAIEKIEKKKQEKAKLNQN